MPLPKRFLVRFIIQQRRRPSTLTWLTKAAIYLDVVDDHAC
jgi:hypothetical protein